MREGRQPPHAGRPWGPGGRSGCTLPASPPPAGGDTAAPTATRAGLAGRCVTSGGRGHPPLCNNDEGPAGRQWWP